MSKGVLRRKGRQPLRILVVDDEIFVHQALEGLLGAFGHRVECLFDGDGALKRIGETDFDLLLVDLRLPKGNGLDVLARARELRPDLLAVIITGDPGLEEAIRSIRLGVADFLIKPVTLQALAPILETAAEVREAEREERRREQVKDSPASGARADCQEFVGDSAATKQLRSEIAQLARAGCSAVLITGETGTGKEVAAQQLHRAASSATSPFVAVNCAALPDSLIESELFGHARGAFTGASKDRPGYFERADGGTLFLDEVGSLSATAQAVLLRALETGTFWRIGGATEITVKVRIVAATNTPLDDLCRRNTFRRDLLYRLNRFEIRLLPLRERRDDILPLADYFLSVCADEHGKRAELAPETEELLRRYDYPGNARELRNIVERAAVLSEDGVIQPAHIDLPQPTPQDHLDPTPRSFSPKGPVSPERAAILAALEKARWNRRQASRDLAMPYSTLRYKMIKLGLS